MVSEIGLDGLDGIVGLSPYGGSKKLSASNAPSLIRTLHNDGAIKT